MSRIRIAVVLVCGMLLLGACAAGVNPEVGTSSPDGGVAGSWLDLWHGVIARVTFVISLFIDSVNLYEVHNNGNWYDFGFVLGAGILLGGGGLGKPEELVNQDRANDTALVAASYRCAHSG